MKKKPMALSYNQAALYPSPISVENNASVVASQRLNTSPKLRLLWRELVAVVVLLAAAKLGLSSITYLLLCLWALQGPRQSIESLTLSFLTTFLNPGIFSVSESFGLLRWLVLGTATLVICGHALQGKLRISYPVLYAWCFCIVAMISACFTSYDIGVSLSKLIVFMVGVTITTWGFQLTSRHKKYWRSWFFTLFFAVLVFSAPTYFLSVGRIVNDKGFQGILNHPQAFGIFLAPVIAWLTGIYITKEYRSSLLSFVLILGWFFMLSSLARTGIISIILSLIVALLISFFHKNNWRDLKKNIAFNNKTAVLLFVFFGGCVSSAIVKWPTVQLAIQTFILKGDNDDGLSKGFQESRGYLIQQSMQNFQQSPWFGNGFGTASDPNSLKFSPDKTLGIATGDAVEKGFLPSALLEWTGLVGAFLFIAFIFRLTRAVVYKSNFPLLWMFLTCISVNIGEMVIFSFGGIGLYLWLLMSAAKEIGVD